MKGILITLAAFTVVSPLVAFGISQMLIALRVGFPFTKFLEKKYGGVQGGEIRKRCCITVFIWLVLLGLVAAGLFWWGNQDVLIGAGIGAAFALVLSINGTKPGPSTIGDYFNAYGRFISEETVQKIQESQVS